MASNPANLWVLLGLGLAGIFLFTKKFKKVLREDFGAFIHKLQLLPPPQPAPPKAPHPLTGLTFAVSDLYVPSLPFINYFCLNQLLESNWNKLYLAISLELILFRVLTLWFLIFQFTFFFLGEWLIYWDCQIWYWRICDWIWSSRLGKDARGGFSNICCRFDSCWRRCYLCR